MAAHSAVISLNKLRVQLRLGWSEAERATAQSVDVSVKFLFDTPPKGCVTDALEDTVCYDDIAQAIRAHCAGREFRLLERLGKELFDVVRTNIEGRQAKLWVRVTKCAPPIEGVESSDFVYSDLPPQITYGIS